MLEYIKTTIILVACLIILLTLFRLKSENIRKEMWGFLWSSFFLTLLLLLIFEFKPHHLLREKLGISNLITYLFYFVLFIIYLLKYFNIIIRINYFLIIIAFTFFGLANAVDLFSDGKLIVFNYSEIIEGTLHILGSVFWMMFFLDYLTGLKNKYL